MEILEGSMPLSLKAGEVLHARYKIYRIIGQGGMGSIYLADDHRLEGRQCAVKEVEHDKTLPEELIRQARDQFHVKQQYWPAWIIPTCQRYLITFPLVPVTTW